MGYRYKLYRYGTYADLSTGNIIDKLPHNKWTEHVRFIVNFHLLYSTVIVARDYTKLRLCICLLNLKHKINKLFRDGEGNILDPELSSPVELYRQHSLSSESRTRLVF